MHISRIDDPNEELLHWLHVLELSQSVYSAAPATAISAPRADAAPRLRTSAWEQITEDAFFALAVDVSARSRFVRRERREAHDELLVQTLEDLLTAQRQRDHEQELRRSSGAAPDTTETTTISSNYASQTDAQAVRVTFVETLARIAPPPTSSGHDASARAETIRRLRKTFAALRRSGLLFLEDPDADRHVLVSFEYALAPALLQQLHRTSYECSRSLSLRLLIAHTPLSLVQTQ